MLGQHAAKAMSVYYAILAEGDFNVISECDK